LTLNVNIRTVFKFRKGSLSTHISFSQKLA